MLNRRSALAAFVAVILGSVMTTSVGGWAGGTHKTTYVTFSGPVGIPGVTLPGGTYVFELLDQHPTIVRVLSRDRSQLYLMAFTRLVSRPADLPADRMISLGEAREGMVAPVRVWYPVGDEPGREFIYSRSRNAAPSPSEDQQLEFEDQQLGFE